MGAFDNLFNEKSKNSNSELEITGSGALNKAYPDNHQINIPDDNTRTQKKEDKKREKND